MVVINACVYRWEKNTHTQISYPMTGSTFSASNLNSGTVIDWKNP
jgi:hypothetical protein